MAKPLFRAEHIGSLLRPKNLLDARTRLEGDQYVTVKGSRAFEQLAGIEDAAIVDALALQKSVGLEVFTDGEFRRRSWYQDFVVAIAGTTIAFVEPGTGGTVSLPFEDAEGADELPGHQIRVDGRLTRDSGIFTDAYAFLAEHAPGPTKATMPAPSMLHFFGGRQLIDATIYPDLDAFWDDLVGIYLAELNDLHALGCRYVQFDDVTWAVACDPRAERALNDRGDPPRDIFNRYAEVLNAIVAGAPADMRIALHTCRGNNRGKWMAGGGYELISQIIFTKVNIDTYFMEYDTDRAGDFRPLRHVPEGKNVVLGLVSTKTPVLEARDAVRRRIDEAAQFLPLDQLCLSPQCGFASNFMGNPLSEADQRAKLELVVELAAEIWGDS